MPLASLIITKPFAFAVFEWSNQRFGSKWKGPIVGGCMAGCLIPLLACPFSVVQVQMQANSKDVYQNPVNVMTDIWRSRGILGFYRGLGASLIMSVPSLTLFMGSYGILRENLPQSKWTPAFAGMTASISMWTCLLPFDNVKTVMQARSFKTGEHVEGWSTQLRQIVKSRGFGGLWIGFPAVLMRAPIVNTCSMMAYEQARHLVDTWQ